MGNKPDFYNPIYYSIVKKPFFRYRFPGLDGIQVNHSQLHQDLFVLSALQGKRKGVYCEIGAHEPIFISNTYLLEQVFGWRGLGFERNGEMVSRHKSIRQNPCLEADALTVDYEMCLEEAGMPRVIDYLSVDIDPPANSLKALQRLPHHKYRFRVITFEHDYSFGGVKERSESRAFLKDLGYQLVVSDVSWGDHVVEDWWVDPTNTDQQIVRALSPVDCDGLHPHDQYFYNWPKSSEHATATTPTKSVRSGQTGEGEGICIEGWRDLNHSYSLVNQWQLLELLKQPVKVRHRDIAPYRSHWNALANGSGLPASASHLISQVPPPDPSDYFSVIYRIAFPINLLDGPAERLFVFGTSELGHCKNMFAGCTPAEALSRGNVTIITPSQWSKTGFLEEGFGEKEIIVLPHGVSPSVFYPVEPELRNFYRELFGFGKDDFVLLNIGALTQNKGVDLLLQAFAILKPRFPQLKLVIKDQSNLYGRRLKNVLDEMGSAATAGATLSEELLNDIVTISENLDLDALRALYNASDLYVSPYRAEGFNLPPLEAAACGLPIITTMGGSSDEYYCPQIGLQIDSQICSLNPGRYLRPSLESAIDGIASIINKPKHWGGIEASQWVHSHFSWQKIGQRLWDHLFMS